jgi:putative copper resistance protein D
MESQPDIWVATHAALKFGQYVAILAACGVALSVLARVVEAEGRKRSLRLAAMLAVGGALVTCARFGLSVAQMGDPSMIDMVWRFQAGTIIAVALGAAGLVGAAALGPGRSQPVFAGMGALALAASFGLTGHTQGLEEPGPWPFVVALHVALASFWAGSVIVLRPSRGHADFVLANRAEAFGRVAMAAAPLLIGLGGLLAFRLSGGLNALIGSNYGLALLAKSLAVAGALAIGAHNKLAVTPMLRTDPVRGRAALKRALWLDAFLFAAALFAIAAATTMFGPA